MRPALRRVPLVSALVVAVAAILPYLNAVFAAYGYFRYYASLILVGGPLAGLSISVSHGVGAGGQLRAATLYIPIQWASERNYAYFSPDRTYAGRLADVFEIGSLHYGHHRGGSERRSQKTRARVT